MSESCTLAREKRVIAGARREKVWLYSERRQVPRRRGKSSKENLPRKSRRKHNRVSGCKNFPEGSGKSWFQSKRDKTEMGKGWETKGPLINSKGEMSHSDS